MALDPITLLICGTCMMACWPCLLPCCIAFSIMPYPFLIIQSRNANKPGLETDSQYYFFCLENGGIVLKKRKRSPKEKSQ